ncbi:transcriptional regulator, TetR family [Granulicella pectinivorans]|jgi:AcrR family transcriptional regulator|uniref:Transcriptional regulator, TetR family n=1 Tax=Granulicella pectinivorans TaxID=474950 RepID=A0A1I6LKT3_9BACT|nr:TetR/AcrR family transcriptional regulator [Granulicella pectinivorans]SFS04147.1 transcriptional regulator, TetR family [Granulicella pectinivorans]
MIENTVQKISKHEMRTRATRELLLQAAETVFARDGYERAELGAIATLAGRTKGAIYAQFKSKEDVFLALVTKRVGCYRAEVEELLRRSSNREESLAAFRQYCLRFAFDQSWALLMMEYKLYVIRHPDAKAAHLLFRSEMTSGDRERGLTRIFGPAGTGQGALSRAVGIEMVYSLLLALAVDMRFSSEAPNHEVVNNIANRIFDALLDTAAQPES